MNSGLLSADHFPANFYGPWHDDDFLCGDGNCIWHDQFDCPLQIGARDVAFPFLNAVSFWLFAVWRMFFHGFACDRGIFCGRLGWLSPSFRD